MPAVSANLNQAGALIEIFVGWSATYAAKKQAAGVAIPAPRHAVALLDTGADVTCIDPSLSQQLEFPVEGFAPANLPALGGLTIGTLLPISLTIQHPSGVARKALKVRHMSVLELPLANLPFQALIGRDILSRCRFVFDGPRNRFRLVY